LVLTPRHFQNFIKRLRKSGHKIRYLVAGEYGEKFGRAHFHAILFFKGPAPKIPHKTNCNISAWPFGHVFADWTGEDKSIRYVCKYLTNPEKGKGWFSISKKPALGWDYFQNRAQQYIEAGVMPRGWEYLPPGGQQNRPYLLTGATRRDFLLTILGGMVAQIRDESTRSEWVQKSVEKVLKWQHLRNLPKQETDDYLSELRETLDRDRLSVPDAEAIAEWAHRPMNLWEKFKLQELINRNGVTDGTAEQGQKDGSPDRAEDGNADEWR
jgi:hypothetical protein